MGTYHGLLDSLLSLFSAQNLIHLHLLVLVLQHTRVCRSDLGELMTPIPNTNQHVPAKSHRKMQRLLGIILA